MCYIVYKTTNSVNGKFYIGKQAGTDDNYIGSGKLLKRAVDKYGKDNFEKVILYVFDIEQEAFDKEKEIVDENFVAREDTYNITLGGHGSFHHLKGQILSDDHKKAVSDARKGKTATISTRLKMSKIRKGKQCGVDNPMYGKHHTEDTKRKLSDANKGKHLSEEHKQKISERAKERFKDPTNHPCFGKKRIQTEETRKKISSTLKQRREG